MKEEKNKELLFSVIISVLLVVITGASVCVCSWFLLENEYQIIRNGVMAVMGTLVVLYIFWISVEKGKLDYQKKEYGVSFRRFAIVYSIGLLFALVCPILPYAGWPYMVLFAALACFSNMACGVAAGSIFLMITILLVPGAGIEIFILYFMSGIVAIVLFQNIDETFQVGIPIVLSILFLLVCEMANIILFVDGNLRMELFVIPVINIGCCAIILVVLIKLHRYLTINKDKKRCWIVVAEDYPLMVQLKEKNRKEYNRAIHTAYLSERIAQKLHLDETVAKTAASYLRIGILQEENNWDSAKRIYEEHKFPSEVRELLWECLNDNRPKKKETIVVLVADEVIATLQEIFAKNKEADVDYAQVVDKIYKEKIAKGILRDNPITFMELQIMRKQFLEEKLYYDILR